MLAGSATLDDALVSDMHSPTLRLLAAAQAREKEDVDTEKMCELVRALRELPAQERENATLEAPSDFSVAKLQASLPPATVLVEYYSTGDRLLAAVVSRGGIEIVPVSVVSRVTNLLHFLRFQFAKFRMGTAYTARFAQPLLRATQGHLEGLYRELIEPIRGRLACKHLVFVPHGPLHFLPFHALRDGEEYLCDSYTVSYAPSATVFGLCQHGSERNANPRGGALRMHGGSAHEPGNQAEDSVNQYGEQADQCGRGCMAWSGADRGLGIGN